MQLTRLQLSKLAISDQPQPGSDEEREAAILRAREMRRTGTRQRDLKQVAGEIAPRTDRGLQRSAAASSRDVVISSMPATNCGASPIQAVVDSSPRVLKIEDSLKDSDRPLCVASTKCLKASSLEDLPVFPLYPSPGIAEILCGILMLARKTLWMTSYCFDSSTGVATLGALLRKGIDVSILFDGRQMKSPSCSRQLSAILGLWDAAIGDGGRLSMRSYTPTGSGFPTMHVKSWCLDETVYVGGSYNFTHNAETSNNEHLVVARCQEACEVYRDLFLRLVGICFFARSRGNRSC